MPHYRYTAINKENKQLSGTIEAGNDEQARAELNNFGFSVISLNILDEKELQQKISVLPKFEFEAFDKKGEKIIGTIPAPNSYQAFKKLVDEYSFQIISIYPASASPEEKEKIKTEGISKLKIQYEQERQSEIVAAQSDETLMQEQTQAELKQYVNVLVAKTEEILRQYEKDLTPERKKEIQNLINKILRIKNSSNFNFIKKSCIELLEKLQQEELLIQEEAKINEKNKIQLESKKLLLNLNKINIGKADISQDLQRLQARIEKIPFLKNKLASLFSFFQKITTTDERILNLRIKRKILFSQMWEYGKAWLTAPKEEKTEALTSLKNLWHEYAITRQQINQIKKQIQEENKIASFASGKDKTSRREFSRFLETINLFSGALLTFYLIYYFMANYFLTKNFSIKPSWNFQIYNSYLLKYLITFIFLFHCSFSLKLNFFKKNPLSSFIIFPSAFLIMLFIYFNL